MKLEDFKALSEEEQSTFLSTIETNEKTIQDLTAERNSFKTENDELKKTIAANETELKATKELNFTLARKINTAPKADAETVLFNFMKGQ